MDVLKSIIVPMGLISPNMGQIKGLPTNPRVLDDKSMRFLVKSIKDNPEMLGLRELLVYKNEGEYVIIGGNMRYRAMLELGYEEAPCKVIPEGTDVQKLRAYTIKDNVAYGEWNQEDLETWDGEELESWGVVLKAKEEETPKEVKEEMRSMDFTLNPEQFKFVKKRFREEGDSDAEALLNVIRNYGRA